jgi:citrate lyase subunit beta-like protein
MGFEGKQVIHPEQVQIVQNAFTPSPQQIASALKILAEFEQQKSLGKGSFGLEGKMIDAPVIKSAEKVLNRARVAGLL